LAEKIWPLKSHFAFGQSCKQANYELLDDLHVACLHDQNKSSFFGGPVFSSQSELFENFSNCSDWLKKSRSFKKATFVLIM